MALDEFDSVYKQRIGYPRLYESVSDFGRRFLKSSTEVTFGVPEPKRIARAMLVFGYFDGGDRMQCQPWIGISKEQDVPFHADADMELRSRQRATRQLSFDGTSPVLSDHCWTMYLGVEDTDTPDSYTAIVGLATHQGVLYEQKLAAAAAATKPRQVMENHIICAKFDMLGRAVRIQNGQTHELTPQPRQ
jgi:hypothetical protein